MNHRYDTLMVISLSFRSLTDTVLILFHYSEKIGQGFLQKLQKKGLGGK